MNSQNSNPFVLPGFGQAGDYSQNPLLASMEMMRQAWQGLATSGVLAQPPVSPALTTEDLDRRISDLRAVENWLRLNMSMLTSSIQALEVQRATIATLKSFANVPGVPSEGGDNPSPLEVALGIKPSGQAKIKTPTQAHPDTAAAPETSAGSAGGAAATPGGFQADPAALSGAAQGWWDMLQQQFDTLAAATVAGMQEAGAAAGAAGSKGAATRTAAAKRARKAAANSPAAGAKRVAGKKAAVKKKATKTVRKSAAR
ncbi:PhaM family polyhydroxyalkanoate granule multifunctional regulatory protein [Pusillimonas sp.]|uniref:PhaM family polyhydroxyalkanoate granule multifunctional regulatory protein n=1 Tax=Pusillimonas sp. TaxID=3040095 RepID=UPI0037CA0AF0